MTTLRGTAGLSKHGDRSARGQARSGESSAAFRHLSSQEGAHGLTISHLQPIIMVMSTTTSLADAKNRLSEIVQSAMVTHERVTITKNGRPAVVLISVDDLESLEETLAVMSDAALMQAIREGEAALDSGDFVGESEVRADLASRSAPR